MSHSIILTVSHLVITVGCLCFCCFVMKQMWPFCLAGIYCYTILVHDAWLSILERHTEGIKATHATMWPKWIDASASLLTNEDVSFRHGVHFTELWWCVTEAAVTVRQWSNKYADMFKCKSCIYERSLQQCKWECFTRPDLVLVEKTA